MRPNRYASTRRGVLAGLAAGAAAALVPRLPARAASAGAEPLLRPIPSTGERIPAIGLGTWITFNVGAGAALRNGRAEVLRSFFARGGTVIDSSPMYGSSEDVVGYGLARLGIGDDRVFSATKVWTPFRASGRDQMAQSRRYWGLGRFDLMQVHNLVNWEGHLETLREDRKAGRVRYIGITTSHGSRHREFLRIMETEALDTVQFTYNIVDREAERRLLPLAAERGLAVIVNRPFRQGALIERLARHPLPLWAAEFDCANWAQFLLKFIVSHPAVTCAIPATSRVDHMEENMGALHGRLPDADMRRRMIRYVEDL